MDWLWRQRRWRARASAFLLLLCFFLACGPAPATAGSPPWPGSFPVARRDRSPESSSPARSRDRARSLRAAMAAGQVLSPGRTSGEYMVRMELGTPPQEAWLTIDTGSGLLWTQCRQCSTCFPSQRDAAYDPTASSSYQRVSHQDSACASAPARDPGIQTFHDGSSCAYRYSYADGSFTEGDLSKDVLTIDSGFGSRIRIPGVVFGCGLNNQGLFEQESGILGLGRSFLGLPQQLANVSGTKFRHCFTDRIKQEDAMSFLSFGELPRSSHQLTDIGFDSLGHNSKMLFTPFVSPPREAWQPDPDSDPGTGGSPAQVFYFLNLTGISVAGQRLPVPRTAPGGTVIDSGTTFSVLATPVLQALVRAFSASLASQARPPVAVPSPASEEADSVAFHLCYNVSQERFDSTVFPEVSLFFQRDGTRDEEVEMVLPTDNVMVPAAETAFCLAFLSAEDDGATNIVGNFQQENYLMEYDLLGNRLGFQRASCAFQA